MPSIWAICKALGSITNTLGFGGGTKHCLIQGHKDFGFLLQAFNLDV
jgi:hypothetical protein